MQTRTRLTTPPGDEPAPVPSARGGEASHAGEAYVPAFVVPTEPHVGSRYRPVLLLIAVVVALIVLAYGVLQIVTSGEDFDPAVGNQPGVPGSVDAPEGSDG